MENRELKSFDDIVNYLEFIETEYNKGYNELIGNKIGIFDKKEKELQKRELRKSLFNYVKTYEKYDRFLKDATTFRRQDFVKFLADYFSIVYEKKYVVQTGISDKKQSYSIITYDLIISENDLLRFSGNDKMLNCLEFSKLFDSCCDCCLLLDDSLKFTLLDGINLSSDFADFPELMGAARAMVGLKLSNPEMSDQKRLMSILSSTCLDLKTNYEDSHQKLGKTYSEN